MSDKEMSASEEQSSMDRSRLIKGTLITLLGGAFWGANGTLTKYLMDTYAVDPLWLVCVRELGSCWFFLATAYFIDRKRLKSAASSSRTMLNILLIGIGGILFNNVAYLEAIDYTNSATATVMQSLNILVILGWTALVYKQKPSKREGIGICLALVGTYLITTGGDYTQLKLPPEGIFWGFMTTISSALLLVLAKNLLEKYGSLVFNGFAMLFSGIAFSLYVQPWNAMPELDATGIALVWVSIIAGTYGAYALFMHGIKEIGSMRGSMMGTVEPIVALATSVIFLGASFSFAEIIGFIFVMIMVVLTAKND